MKLLHIFLIVFCFSIVSSCNDDDIKIDPTITEPVEAEDPEQPEDPENPENPEEPEEPSDPNEEYVFSLKIQTLTSNPCNEQYCRLLQLSFIDSNIGYAVTGVDVYKTSNGGEHWNHVLNQDIVGKLDVINENDLYINVYDGIIKTTNGFSSNQMFSKPFSQFACSSGYLNEGINQFIGNSTGFIQDSCNKGWLYKTENDGQNWVQIYNNNSNEIDKYYFEDSNNGFMLVNNSIYVTYDGGNTWNSQTYIPSNINYILYLNNKFMFPGGEELKMSNMEVINYSFNDIGEIIAYVKDLTNNEKKLILYVRDENPQWVDVNDEYNFDNCQLALTDDKTIYVGFFNGTIHKYYL